MREKGNVYLSTEIKNRIAKDKVYLSEIYEILRFMTSPFNQKPRTYDCLNTEEQAQQNVASLANGENPVVTKQYTSSQGRIYIETKSKRAKAGIFKYLVTNIFIYGATEYEYHKDETKFITFDECAAEMGG